MLPTGLRFHNQLCHESLQLGLILCFINSKKFQFGLAEKQLMISRLIVFGVCIPGPGAS